MKKINLEIIEELKNLGVTIDLTNSADLYAIAVLEEKTGEERKKFLDFFVKTRKKDYEKDKFYDDVFEKVMGKNRKEFQKEMKEDLNKPKKQSKKDFWGPVLLGALVGLFWDL